MFNFFKKMLGLPTAEEKAAAKAPETVGNTSWPFPVDEKPAEVEKVAEVVEVAKVKKARAPKKPRAKKAK